MEKRTESRTERHKNLVTTVSCFAMNVAEAAAKKELEPGKTAFELNLGSQLGVFGVWMNSPTLLCLKLRS
ncbi:hypothetical protein V6N12_010011 [Hibiscus sabdariffa]|uniref:Uncharacterized protein n=1 Tax=Hibiscus sabdariffa TaxID=183260 RepID=A0ABR2EE67_9ROSI